MDIKQFSEKYHLRLRRDSCGEDIIPGSRKPKDMPARVEFVCHIYDHGDGVSFGLMMHLRSKQQWTYAKKTLVAGGFVIRQNADSEGTALFNPEDRQHVRVAVKLARIRTRRQLPPQQREALAARLKLARESKDAREPALEPVESL